MSVERFAGYVATLGRGPGRSRALTREEAADAAGMLLRGEVEPEQVGAFLMLLRYRGEDPAEIAGLVEGLRAVMPAWEMRALAGRVALDWPSYGAGRSRGAPWFLLAALALGQSGVPVLMHGTNEFSGGMTVAAALARLGVPLGGDLVVDLTLRGFVYVPVERLHARFAALLGLRRVLGLRSPLNTVARLLNPAGAAASVDGVFHPPYIETHLAVAPMVGQQRLVVLKGGGGEAERNPAKPVSVHLWDAAEGRREIVLPALVARVSGADEEPEIAAVWRGEVVDPAIEARIVGTVALGLMAVARCDERQGDAEAHVVWQNRRAIG